MCLLLTLTTVVKGDDIYKTEVGKELSICKLEIPKNLFIVFVNALKVVKSNRNEDKISGHLLNSLKETDVPKTDWRNKVVDIVIKKVIALETVLSKTWEKFICSKKIINLAFLSKIHTQQITRTQNIYTNIYLFTYLSIYLSIYLPIYLYRSYI